MTFWKKYKFLSALEYAPDGTHAASVVSKADLDHNGYLSWLYLYDAAKGDVRQLTTCGQEKSFVWLDDTTVLFPRNAGQRAEKAGGGRGALDNSLHH